MFVEIAAVVIVVIGILATYFIVKDLGSEVVKDVKSEEVKIEDKISTEIKDSEPKV